MNNLHIVTVATDPKYYFPYLVESCKRNGKELEVLGFGEKWKGFYWKYELMIEYLKSVSENDIVCFIDGYDVICTNNLNKLKDVFIKIKNEKNCKIIVGHDKIQNNFLFKFFHNIFFGKCNNISINSGTYIGYSKDILYILENMINNKKDENDDQILLTNYCINNPNDIYIDVDSELFLTLLYPLTDLDKYVEIKNNKLIYNNNEPYFIHAAGYGFLDNILIKLNYNYNDNIKKQYYNDIYKKRIYHYIKNFKRNYKMLSFLIIILLLLCIIGLYYLIKYIYKFFIKNKKLKKYYIIYNFILIILFLFLLFLLLLLFFLLTI